MSDGINLTDRERSLLAWRLILDHARHVDDWLEWEDVPELGEDEFVRLLGAVSARVTIERDRVGEVERAWDIDTSEILERVR